MLNPKLILTDLENKNPCYLLNQQTLQCCAELTEVDIQNLTPVQSKRGAIRGMEGWNKQFDEPESLFGRILIVHLKVRKLLETSEIFWRWGGGCVKAFVCFGLCCRKISCWFMYFRVTGARLRNIKQKEKAVNAAPHESVSGLSVP